MFDAIEYVIKHTLRHTQSAIQCARKGERLNQEGRKKYATRAHNFIEKGVFRNTSQVLRGATVNLTKI